MPKLMPIECPHGTHVGYCPQCRIESLEAERDALAAHVERVRIVWDDLTAHATYESLLEIMERVFADAPTTSLARLKAEWLKGIQQQSRRVRNYSSPDQVFEAIPLNAIDCELRRQAEEPSA